MSMRKEEERVCIVDGWSDCIIDGVIGGCSWVKRRFEIVELICKIDHVYFGWHESVRQRYDKIYGDI